MRFLSYFFILFFLATAPGFAMEPESFIVKARKQIDVYFNVLTSARDTGVILSTRKDLSKTCVPRDCVLQHLALAEFKHENLNPLRGMKVKDPLESTWNMDTNHFKVAALSSAVFEHLLDAFSESSPFSVADLASLVDLKKLLTIKRIWNAGRLFGNERLGEIRKILVDQIEVLEFSIYGSGAAIQHSDFGEFLAKSKSLKSLDLSTAMSLEGGIGSGCSKQYLLYGLRKSPSLERISFVDQALRDEGVGQILEALESNNKIKVINFSSVYLTDVGARRLLTFVKEHPQIEQAFINANPYVSEEIKESLELLLKERTPLRNPS